MTRLAATMLVALLVAVLAIWAGMVAAAVMVVSLLALTALAQP